MYMYIYIYMYIHNHICICGSGLESYHSRQLCGNQFEPGFRYARFRLRAYRP